MKESNLYHIIEVANTHGGQIGYLKDLINAFSTLKKDFGMKFQPLKADTLATPSFEWYPVYQELFFSEEQWKEIISFAAFSKDIWLDILDLYAVRILDDNIDKITGIKFQSSVLYNLEVIAALQKLNLSKIKLILNVAAREIEEIKEIIKRIEKELNPEEVILEFGFQGYPTSIQDCGLAKIPKFQENFSNKLVFADHTDGSSEDALWLPIVAATLGVDIIEKHVMLDKPTKYDHFSSLTPSRYEFMVKKINEYVNLKNKEFINQREIDYLQNSLMSPILKQDKEKGALISFKDDFEYKRTGKNGLNVKQIEELQKNLYVFSNFKKKGDVLKKSDFKKANIATIIACRLKSTRLPNKALLRIGNLTSVEYCIANTLKFENVQHTILATSTVEQDAKLEDYTLSPSVIFHKGDPDDVIQRYLDVCDDLKIDVFIRVTADMPFIDNEICQFILHEHFKSGADYTTANEAAVGTNLEIINVQALKTVKKFFPVAEYSEYMTWYFQNNPEHFRLNFVDLPKELIRNYRLTLDYQEDLDLFNAIDSHLNGKEYTIDDIFEILDKNQDLPKINGHLTLKYKTDEALIQTLNKKTKINSN